MRPATDQPPETAIPISGDTASPDSEQEDGNGRTRALVLVVDDDRPSAEGLAQALHRLGYAVMTAESGRSALERAADLLPDVVLLDITMPDMSGLEVLRRLQTNPATADLAVILVSGLDHTDIIVEGLKLGANDYMTKPVNLPVLEAKVATRTAMKRTRDELKQTVLRQAAELDQQARELKVARHVQRSILPREPFRSESLATAWCYESATEVGGDLFDVVPLPGGRVLLFVADAMGHGVQAALVVSTVKATLAAHLNEADDLSILMGLLDLAIGDLFQDRFVTAAVCLVDPRAGTLRYVSAGHPPVLVSGSRGVRSLPANNPVLGLQLGLVFQEGEVTLDPGASILLYTDGLTEAQNPHHVQFGDDALARVFGALAPSSDPDTLVQGIRTALDDFRGPAPLTDDLTILAARLL